MAAYVALEPRFFERPRITKAGRDAREVYVVGLCYVAQYLTGGFVPSAALHWAEVDDRESAAQRLIDCGLWERCDGGYMVIQDEDDPHMVQWHVERERPNGPAWQQLRSQVFERDGYTCQYCGATGVALHCDHIIPIYRGGSDKLKNLTTACEACNLSKNKKSVEAWQKRG